MRTLTRISTLIASVVVVATAGAQPQYQIFDIGVIQAGDSAAQGFGVSPGGVGVGRSIRNSQTESQAFTWTVGGGLAGLPNLASRPHAVSNDANDNGIVVGTAATTLFGSSRLPVIWTNGVVAQLPLPAGETLGDANGVNAAGIAVGSVDGGTLQQAVIYNGGTATVITQTTPDGSFFLTAFGINDSNRIVGQGIDPNNAARNVGIVYDMGSPAAFEVGALPGANGALAFGVGNGGHVVGSSMMNQGSGLPFIWSQANGMVAIPLATGTSEGSARAVNTAGWVVGQDSSAFSIPFLWDGTTTYRLADLLPPGSGWDLSTNTSSSALGISDNNVIVGTGVRNAVVHAYAMVPVAATPTPSPTGTPSPSPAPTCTPVPVFTADFDGVTPPALPAGWITTFTPGAANCTPIGTCALGTNWATSTTNPFSPPNSAFHNAPGCVTDSTLDTPSFVSGTLSTSLIFHHRYDLEDGLDGGVLEISINGGAFTDIIAAGGQFVNPGAYNGTISAGSLNPIAGRQAWTGNSGGYIQSRVEFPPSALFQPVRLRFRLATGCSGAGTGWWIDSISVTYPPGCPTPPPSPSPSATPPPTTPTPSPTATPSTTPTPSVTPSTTPSEPHFEVNAPSSVIAGFPFDITVTAKIFGNVFTNYTGTVHFTSTSTGLGTNLPPDSTLTNGVGTFSVTLGSLGFQTITATDTVNPSMTGTSGNIRVDLKPPGSPTPSPTPSPTATPPPTPTPTPVAQALNLSTRMRVQTGENVGIGGFIITGTAPKHVLLRAIGPSLSPALSNVLADPVMELHGSSPFVTIVNDNWRDDPAQEALIIASGIPPTNNAEAAIDATLPSGSYTAIVSGKNNTSGVGLVEAYDLDQAASSKLSNISTRAFVETGEDVVIAGFILGGSNGSDRVIVRGIGPSLTAAGVADALADPTLELRDSNGALLASNNNWHDDPTQAAELIASGLAPTNDLEAAIAATLPPGPFTVLLAGANNGIGVGLVEVYDRGAP